MQACWTGTKFLASFWFKELDCSTIRNPALDQQPGAQGDSIVTPMLDLPSLRPPNQDYNLMAVAYSNHQGGTRKLAAQIEADVILTWQNASCTVHSRHSSESGPSGMVSLPRGVSQPLLQVRDLSLESLA